MDTACRTCAFACGIQRKSSECAARGWQGVSACKVVAGTAHLLTLRFLSFLFPTLAATASATVCGAFDPPLMRDELASLPSGLKRAEPFLEDEGPPPNADGAAVAGGGNCE